MKIVIRQAPLFAGVILTLMVFAVLDRIPDNPGEFKERRFQQGQPLKAADPMGFDAKSATFVTRAIPSRNICDRIIHFFDAESTTASAGIFDLRSAADSSPPACAA